MDRKLIFFDVDGTLVTRRSSPTPAVRRAIRQARANGHLVFVCTGRNMPIIRSDILDIGFDGIIASAGAYVTVGGEVLLDLPLPEELVQECLAVFHGLGMFCRLETGEGVYIDEQLEQLLRTATPDPRNYELIRMQREFDSAWGTRRYDEYPKQGAYKICFISTGPAAVEEARKALGDRFKFVVHRFVSNASCINGEIIAKWCGKGRAMELVCQRFGDSVRNAIAFGDSMNDAEILRAAGIGIAMGNAEESVKEIADQVCESCEEDGIAKALERMHLI